MYTGPNIATDGLVLSLDAANTKSYPGSGTNWQDLSGNNNTGVLTNGPTFSSDNGGSIVFDGTNDSVDCGNNPSVSLGSAGSVSMWIKTNRTYPSNTTSVIFRGLAGKVAGGGTGQQSYYIDWYGSNSYNVLRTSIGDSVSATVCVVNNYFFGSNWRYITSAWTDTYLQLWIDGVRVSQVANTRSAQVISNTLKIGYVFGGWEGNIALTQIYNRALSSEEILQNYNATKPRFGL